MPLLAWAREASSLGICEGTTPSLFMSFARKDFSLKCALPGVMVSMV